MLDASQYTSLYVLHDLGSALGKKDRVGQQEDSSGVEPPLQVHRPLQVNVVCLSLLKVTNCLGED